MNDLVSKDLYPSLHTLVGAVLEHWPKHLKYMTKNLGERDDALLKYSERLSAMVMKLVPTVPGGLESLAADYRFISEQIVMPEEIHFRRHDSYRLKTFQEALDQVYSNKPFMTRYMNGLLMSDVLWINHCRCMRHYSDSFLPSLPAGADVLEIGPGHGLLMCLATQEPRVGSLTAWDVSDASLDLSKHSLHILNPGASAKFVKRDLFDPSGDDDGRFDAVVLSEVLEHLEEPAAALAVLRKICKPGGKVWVNVPANSPAPDHLFLVRSPEQAADLMRSCGFDIVEQASFPMSGSTIEHAVKQKLTINCVVVGQRPV